MLGLLEQQPDSAGKHDDELRMSHRRELFRWAADRVMSRVTPTTWQAFWLTSVEEQPAEDVAHTLGLSVGAVYIARSRVLSRLRSEVREWEGDDALS